MREGGADPRVRWTQRLGVHLALGMASVIALAVGATLVLTSRIVTQQALVSAADGLAASQAAFRRLVDSRADAALDRVRLVTMLPVFRAHLADPRLTGDGPTMAVMAEEYRQQLSAQFLIVTSRDGRVLARSAPSRVDESAVVQEGTAHALAGRPWRSVAPMDGRIYLAVSEAARFGDELVGALTVGYELDDAIAHELADVTGSDIVLVADSRVAATSVSANARRDFEPFVTAWTGQTPARVSVAGVDGSSYEYVAAAYPLEPSAPAAGGRIVLLRDWHPTAQVVRAVSQRVLLGGIVITACALFAAAALSARMSQPLNDVADAAIDIASGNWSRQVPVRGSAEAVTTAVAFNTMGRELQHIYDKLVLAKAAAEQASAAKSAFLANMSHELRTPLHTIIGHAEMLAEDADADGDDQRASDLALIVSAGRHLGALINDILDLSKIEAGRMELSPEVFDAAHAVRDVVRTSESLAQVHGNRIMMCGIERLGVVRSDRTKVCQVLLNLVGNACKFTSNGLVTVSGTRARIGHDDWIVVEVADTGVGMTPEVIGRLFQEFSQGDESVSRRFGGTGLGLAISQRLCRLMGGHIEVESREGEGSRFTVRLPAEVAGEVAVPTGTLVLG